MLEQRSVPITGGAGYVGGVLAPKMLKAGHKITVLDLCLYAGKTRRTGHDTVVRRAA